MCNNFCANCGNKLMENAKFCSNCGKPVESLNENEPQECVPEESSAQVAESSNCNDVAETLDQPPVSPVEMDFCGRKFLFDPSIIEYNKLQKRFVQQGQLAKNAFKSYYVRNVNDFDTLYEKGLSKFLTEITDGVRFGVSVIREYGVLDVDEEAFLGVTQTNGFLETNMDYYTSIAAELRDSVEKLVSYRTQTRMLRPTTHWQGGGFGLGGAIRGALTAGVLNFGTDIVHGLGNALVDSSDRAKLKKLEAEIYQEKEHATDLMDCIEYWYEDLLKAAENILSLYQLLVSPKLDDAKAASFINEANSIVCQGGKQLSPAEYDYAIDLICQGFPYSPFGETAMTAYCTLYQIPQINKSELQTLVKFFGRERKFETKRANIDFEKLERILKDMPELNAEQIDEKIFALKKLQTSCSNIDIETHIINLGEKKALIEEGDCFDNLQKIKLTVESLMENENYDEVWQMADKNCAYAQESLRKIIWPVHDGEIDEARKAELEHRIAQGSLFAQAILAVAQYYLIKDSSESTLKKDELMAKCTKEVCELADRGVVFAMERRGFWGLAGLVPKRVGNPYLTDTVEDAISYTQKAANAGAPVSLFDLMIMYQNGRGVPENHEKKEKLARIYYPIYRNQPSPFDSPKSTSGCFITSAVCRTFGKPDDCYELTEFRAFRDGWLAAQPDGPALIQEYYKIAPGIVRQIDQEDDHREIYAAIWRDYLLPCLSFIESKQFLECKRAYVSMVNALKEKYGRSS